MKQFILTLSLALTGSISLAEDFSNPCPDQYFFSEKAATCFPNEKLETMEFAISKERCPGANQLHELKSNACYSKTSDLVLAKQEWLQAQLKQASSSKKSSFDQSLKTLNGFLK